MKFLSAKLGACLVATAIPGLHVSTVCGWCKLGESLIVTNQKVYCRFRSESRGETRLKFLRASCLSVSAKQPRGIGRTLFGIHYFGCVVL